MWFKHIVVDYFDIWWLPAATFFGFLLIFGLAAMGPWESLAILGLISIPGIGFSLIGILAAIIHHFQEDRFGGMIFNLLMIPISGFAIWYTLAMWFIVSINAPDEFADHLTIPADLVVADIRGDWTNRPPDEIRQDRASLDLWNSFQPGIYHYEVWANPGEPGRIYLKAFEVTKGTALSVHSLKERTLKQVDWSKEPSEMFCATAEFTVYEGDWGKPYAGRFEVWFIPNSGQPQRKLMERVFKIEGWQR